MKIYIDESGSINNSLPQNKNFVIALVNVTSKTGIDRAYKRFISSNHDRLLELDRAKTNSSGGITREGDKMFKDGVFQELKGSSFDKPMKKKFIEFFARKQSFELFYIKLNNCKLQDRYCENTARSFNYAIKLALEYFLKNGYLPKEDCFLQLDERNEKTETKFFLENYLNTEIMLPGSAGNFKVEYFDSCNNKAIQIADVFANIFYSNMVTKGVYDDDIELLKKNNILKYIFEFPL
jgi:hypothetical protein